MKIELVVLLIGAVLIIEGLPYFLFPDKIKSYLEKLSVLETKLLRIFGTIMIMIGFLLVVLFKDKVCS